LEILFSSMKNRLLPLVTLVLCAVLPAVHAQPGPRPVGMIGTAPHGPDFAGPAGRLFGDNPSFTANLEMRSTNSLGGSAIVFSGNLAVSGVQSRFEIDMTRTAARANPRYATNLAKMGLDKITVISRPDKKISDIIYPGFNAYAEMPASPTAGAPAGGFKMDITKLGEETVGGHPCVKNKVVVTDDKGKTYESTVWNATDLKSFPVKIEQTEGGSHTIMTFTDVKLGNVDAGQFEPPASATKYYSVGALMQQEITKRANIVRPPQ
jgi:hypothetical protein